MLTVRDLLAAARAAQGLPSNYALAKLIDARERDMSRWQNGHNVPTAAVVVRLAELAQLDPAQVLPAIEAQRPGDAHVREVWRRAADLAERAAAVAVCAVLALCFAGGFDGAAPMAQQAGGVSVAALTVYTLWCVLARAFGLTGRGVNPPPWAPKCGA